MAAAKKTLPPESKAVAAPSQSAETEHRAAADERARDASRAVSATPATAPTTSAAPAGANANRPAPASPPQPMQPPEAARPAAAPKAERPREEDAAPDRSRPDAAARTPAAEEAPAAKAAEPEPQRSAAATALDPARRLEQARGAAAAAADSAPGTSANQSLARRPMPDAATGVAPGENPVARLRAAVAGQPDGWSWQRGSGGEQPMTDAVQAWLGQLDDATRARWQAAAAAAPAADTIAAPLRLFRNGRLHTTVRIEAGAVRLESEADAAAGATVSAAAGAVGAARASVPAAVAASLKAALERAAP
jgi:hypothetical protein